MGIAVAFTNAQTKGRSRQRTPWIRGSGKRDNRARGDAVGAIRIDALTRLATIADSALINAQLPLLAESARAVAGRGEPVEGAHPGAYAKRGACITRRPPVDVLDSPAIGSDGERAAAAAPAGKQPTLHVDVNSKRIDLSW